MKRLLHITLTLMLSMVIASVKSSTALADEGDGGHTFEVEVNGIHVTLSNQNEWEKGENTIIVTLMDNMGTPVRNADVEVLIGPQSGEPAEPEGEHDMPQMESTSAHGSDSGHSSMPGMDMSEPTAEAHAMPSHTEETSPVALSESDQHGTYIAETHFEASGTHEVNVMFHVNGEMLQADFVVEIPGGLSKTIVLWSFVAINVILIASAGMMKKQSVLAKGR